jgi:hypothetical protein
MTSARRDRCQARHEQRHDSHYATPAKLMSGRPRRQTGCNRSAFPSPTFSTRGMTGHCRIHRGGGAAPTSAPRPGQPGPVRSVRRPPITRQALSTVIMLRQFPPASSTHTPIVERDQRPRPEIRPGMGGGDGREPASGGTRDGFRRMRNRPRPWIGSLAYRPVGHPIRRIACRHPPYDGLIAWLQQRGERL